MCHDLNDENDDDAPPVHSNKKLKSTDEKGRGGNVQMH
jgi:hypothetical protein